MERVKLIDMLSLADWRASDQWSQLGLAILLKCINLNFTACHPSVDNCWSRGIETAKRKDQTQKEEKNSKALRNSAVFLPLFIFQWGKKGRREGPFERWCSIEIEKCFIRRQKYIEMCVQVLVCNPSIYLCDWRERDLFSAAPSVSTRVAYTHPPSLVYHKTISNRSNGRLFEV